MEGRQQPTLEELLNKIFLLKKALEFYGEERNYKFNQREINSTSTVHKDMGHQARFALNQIKDIEKYNQSLIEQYKNELEKTKERGEKEALDFSVKLNKLMLNLEDKKYDNKSKKNK